MCHSNLRAVRGCRIALLVPLVILGGELATGADLVPVSLSVDSASASQVRVSTRITNRGEAAAGPFVVQFFYEDRTGRGGATASVLFEARLVAGGLGPGETTWLQATLSDPPCGQFAVTVVADAAGDVPESNEGNNSLSRTLVVPGCDD